VILVIIKNDLNEWASTSEETLRILSWNVNGIRAILKKGAWDWVKIQEADVVCLQEIKGSPTQLPDEHTNFFSGYEPIWNPAVRPGYSGVATFLKKPVSHFSLGLDEVRFDVEGRVIQTIHNDFRLFNIYFPNGQRDHERLSFKLDFYAHLLEFCDILHSKGEKIIICGDFNTAHKEIDLKNPKENEKTSGFLPEERAWVDRYLEHNFVDIYRLVYPDKIQYTWWTYITNARARNVGWRLDYFLISSELVSRVRDVLIHDDVLGSDHCPVSLELS
jgi:exodeoxyribonuclease III